MKIIKRNERLFLPQGIHVFEEPITMETLSSIEGQSAESTIIKFKGSFQGPCIRSESLEQLVATDKWFYEDGVPARMSITNVTIDLSDWKPVHSPSNPLSKLFAFTSCYDVSKFCVAFYAKKYTIRDVVIKNSPVSGLYSSCSVKGGQKDKYYDAPEAFIDNLEINNCKQHGFIFSGPHDSLIKTLIVCNTNGKGVDIISSPKHNGACDIDFIHSYGCGGVAIDVRAKVKARFLQGDTGRGAGVRLTASSKTIVDTIEVFKTRRSPRPGSENYSVYIESHATQIGTIRIRPDAGADGLFVNSACNIINSLHIDCKYPHPDFKHLGIKTPPLPMRIDKGYNIIKNIIIENSSICPINSQSPKKIKKCSLGPLLFNPEGSESWRENLGGIFDSSTTWEIL